MIFVTGGAGAGRGRGTAECCEQMGRYAPGLRRHQRLHGRMHSAAPGRGGRDNTVPAVRVEMLAALYIHAGD